MTSPRTRPGASRRRWIAVALTCALMAGACRRRVPVEAPLSTTPGPEPVTERRQIEGPTRWVADRGDLCVDVVAGWAGWVGDRGALLAIGHASGVEVSVFRDQGGGSRDGFVRMFEDQGSYRDIPVLFPTSTVTWVSEPPGGPTIQEWVGELDGIPVRVEVRYPWGRVIEGRQIAEQVLTRLCRP